MKDQIIKMYLEGISNKEISQKFNIHRSTVQSILKKNNIVLRKQTDTSRKYKILDFFENIDNQNQAYILGFLYADGNVNGNYIDISLHEKDGEILKLISNHFYGKSVLHERKSKEFEKDGKLYKSSRQIRFNICSIDLIKNIKKFGLIENKTFKIRFPNLREDLISHFIRGYFDGDGCLYISKRKGNNQVGIISNPMFCLDLQDIIKKYCYLNVVIKRKTDTVKDLKIFGNIKVKKFLDWIYKDAEMKLERKYKLYIENYK